jgi:hypothetical protein
VTKNTKCLLVMQSKFETVGNHLITSVQMTVIDCDDYNEASTKTGAVARRLLMKSNQHSRENTDAQTVAFLITFPVLHVCGNRSRIKSSLLAGIQYRLITL